MYIYTIQTVAVSVVRYGKCVGETFRVFHDLEMRKRRTMFIFLKMLAFLISTARLK